MVSCLFTTRKYGYKLPPHCQRTTAHCNYGSGPLAAGCTAGRAAIDRHKIRLWRRTVPRLHCAHERKERGLLPHAGFGRRRAKHSNHRRSGRRGEASSGTGGVSRRRGVSMWLLHKWNDPRRNRSAKRKAECDRSRGHVADAKTPLPMLQLPENFESDSRSTAEREEIAP